MRRLLLLLPLCSFALLAGCGNKGPLYMPKPVPAATAKPATPATPAAKPATATPAIAAPAAVHGAVTDMTTFNAFIATHPTADQFRAAYPDVKLVLPGDVSTRELRTDNSRYFAEVGTDGRITGGKFM